MNTARMHNEYTSAVLLLYLNAQQQVVALQWNVCAVAPGRALTITLARYSHTQIICSKHSVELRPLLSNYMYLVFNYRYLLFN